MKRASIIAVLLSVMAAMFLSGCKGDQYARNKFEKAMFSDYTAEIEFVINSGKDSVCGTAIVTKKDTLRIDVLSPDPYAGISISADFNDLSVVSISYDGVKAQVPKNMLERLGAMLSVFSDKAAVGVEKAKKSAFGYCEEISDAQSTLCECKTSNENIEYVFIYDKKSGYPYEIYAKNDSGATEVKFKKIKFEE